MKPARLLEWSKRSLKDRDRIARFYNDEASLLVAVEADAAIQRAANQACTAPELFRSGIRPNTREYVMRRFPFTLIYRVMADKVLIVRVMHQAAKYFN
jgi:plasmid stabilization system protein ParE